MRIPTLFLLMGLALPALAQSPALQEGAPEEYVVQPGDSLWTLAERFLKDPWKWPEIWQMNKDHLKGEHRIYPGNVIRLVRREGDAPHLTLGADGSGLRAVKLSPGVRDEPILQEAKAIPSVPAKALQALIAKGGLVEPGDFDQAPVLLGSNDARVLFGKGDLVYVSHGDPAVTKWVIVRRGVPFVDPSNPRQVLAHELVQVGEAVAARPGKPALFRITGNDQEILERDRLMPAWNTDPAPYIPHAPAHPLEAKVVATLGGQSLAGTWMTVVLDKGLQDGVEQGHVLSLFLAGRDVADPKCLRAEKLAFLSSGHRGGDSDCQKRSGAQPLPDERAGLAFVYRVFKGLSYALVMSSSQPVQAGDLARNP